jgi:hypothetical protein
VKASGKPANWIRQESAAFINDFVKAVPGTAFKIRTTKGRTSGTFAHW